MATALRTNTHQIPGDKDPADVLTRGGRACWWRRVGSKERGFRYVDPQGNTVKDEAQLERVRSLAIPPGYREVRVAPSGRSPLQAVAVDTSGRVQYRYHARHTEKRSRAKYDKLLRFGEKLADLRRKTNADIAGEGLGRERVLAVVIRLINDLYFRLGSEGSVTRYRTFGVTTLRNRHLTIQPDGALVFAFTGKHHVKQRRILADKELADLMAEIKALGGSKLFEYQDDAGQIRAVTPTDVNRYIKTAMGPEFSAKDFRTWGGTLLAAVTLAEMGKPEGEREAKRNVTQALKQVAERLGNTPSVCRDCYVSPVVLERYDGGVTLEDFRPRRRRAVQGRQPLYEPEELALLKLLGEI